jgi:hypothetical protein
MTESFADIHITNSSKTFGFSKHELTLIIPDTNPNINLIQIDWKRGTDITLILTGAGFFNFNFVPAPKTVAAASDETASAARNYPICDSKCSSRAAALLQLSRFQLSNQTFAWSNLFHSLLLRCFQRLQIKY